MLADRLKDPVRQLIADRCRELGISDAQLSRAIGHGDSYMNQFHRRGSPVTLPDRERKAVATALNLAEDSLIASDPGLPAAAAVARQSIMARSGRHIPAFHEGKQLDFDRITDWVERPDFVAMSENSFALYIHQDHGRLGLGDLAFVSGGRPPRPGDIAIALTLDQQHIVAIGTVAEMTKEKATIQDDDGKARALSRAAHVILKVAAVRFA